jgi:hypothetical protein
MKQIVTNFISEFISVQGREPISSEIIDNLKDKIDVKTITTILEDINKNNIMTSTNSNSNLSLVVHASNVANLPV